MKEKTGNVYQDSADRINTILKDTGLTQAALCRLIPENNADGRVDRTFFNQVKNGRKRLSLELAQNIIDTVNKSLPPGQHYRLDWLLGRDEYKTQQEYIQVIMDEVKKCTNGGRRKMSIAEKVGMPAMLEQLAEECAELSHEALKYSRSLRGENPTPKSAEECLADLIEETADVKLLIQMLSDAGLISFTKVELIKNEKYERWCMRIKEGGN